MSDFLKTRPGAPGGFFAAEAAGLRWLAEPSAVPVVEVLETGADFVRLARVEPAPPSAAAAQEFGRGLARLHDAGAPGFGWAPADTAWFGPLDDRSEEHTSELQSRGHLVCRLLLEKKNTRDQRAREGCAARAGVCG